jgi:hypothetical protein
MIAVMTTWRAVRDFEGIYEVSDQGQVRSLGRVVKGRDGSDRYINGKVISQRERPDGTKIVNLWRSNNYRQLPVRRLVLEAFDQPRPRGYDAINTNGDSSDNRLQNLQWQIDRRSRAALRHAVGSCDAK